MINPLLSYNREMLKLLVNEPDWIERYNQTPCDKRSCPVCDSNEIEDEIHFLCYCPECLKLVVVVVVG